MRNSYFQLISLLLRLTSVILLVVLVLGAFTVYLFNFHEPSVQEVAEQTKIEKDRPDVTDFIIDEGYELVVANCTNCHSAKLVTQNRATAEGWRNTIVWMQETQNLWDLGDAEEHIIAYLAKNYAPVKQGRRKNLESIDWYTLEP